MKKLFAVGLLFALLSMLFASCGDIPQETTTPNQETTEKSDTSIPAADEPRYLYDANWTHLIRYDLKTGRSAIACPDPLCEHGENCPVKGINSSRFYVTENYLFWATSGSRDNSVLCYDLKANKITVIYETDAQTNGFFLHGDSLLFFGSQYEYDENKIPIGLIWHLYRYDPQAQTLLRLTEEPLPKSYGIAQKDEDQIIWYDKLGRDNTLFFSTDYDFQNHKDLDASEITEGFIVGDFRYDVETRYSEHCISFTVTRFSLQTGNTEDYIDHILLPQDVTFAEESGILYRKKIPVPDERCVSEEVLTYQSLINESTCFRIALDENYSFGKELGYHDGRQSGNKIAVDVFYNDTENGISYETKGICLIDLANGSYQILLCELTRTEIND